MLVLSIELYTMSDLSLGPLPRLPLYDSRLYPYYTQVKPYLANTTDEELYAVLRNIMLCLAAHGRAELLPKIATLTSLSEVYQFLQDNKVDWEVIFGPKGKVEDSMIQFLYPDHTFNNLQITEVCQAYPRSREGGLSSQMVRASNLIALRHESPVRYQDPSYQTLIRILDSGALNISSRTDQFPAVYFVLDSGTPADIHSQSSWTGPAVDNVAFIFSTALLKSPAWHTNGGLVYGRVDESSYDPTTFWKVLTTNLLEVGEVVIHHACPLDYLEAIVVPDHDVSVVRAIMEQRNDKYPVLSTSEYLSQPYTRYLKGVNEPLTFVPPPLSLAWYVSTSNDDYTSDNTIRKTLINFGLTAQQASEVVREYPMESLLAYFTQLNSITPRLTAPVVIHPPY